VVAGGVVVDIVVVGVVVVVDSVVDRVVVDGVDVATKLPTILFTLTCT